MDTQHITDRDENLAELDESLKDRLYRIEDAAVSLAYTDEGGPSPALRALPPELSQALWYVIDGLPNFIGRWLDGKGSLAWILETTPEVVEAKVAEHERQIRACYTTLGLPLPEGWPPEEPHAD